MDSKMPELKELVHDYLMEHGPSSPSKLYNGVPGVSDAYTSGGFSSRLHDMKFVHKAGYVMLEGQALEPRKLHPPYVFPLLRLAAEKRGICLADVRRTAPSGAESRLEYLKKHGLVERKRTIGPSPTSLYELTEKGRNLQIAMQLEPQPPAA